MESELIKQVMETVWDKSVGEDVFRQWCQGFLFSETERSALVQIAGGPCSVIVSVQAYILKHLLFKANVDPGPAASDDAWRQISDTAQEAVLVNACYDIIRKCLGDRTENEQIPFLILPEDANSCVADSTGCGDSTSPGANVDAANESESPAQQVPDSKVPDSCSSGQCNVKPSASAISFQMFHDMLRVCSCSVDEVALRRFIASNILRSTHSQYSVLLLVYAAIIAQGIDNVKMHMEPESALIENVHGHGSQNLINLLLTGRATSNLWDGIHEVAGMRIEGVKEQCEFGYLTIMEHLRYSKVGSFLKNPFYPIWILASETHLSVLFSTQANLAGAENEQAKALRVFNSFDPEGNGFVVSEKLQEIMQQLELFAEQDYVNMVMDKLDPERLGIITARSFEQEFFTSESSNVLPSTFPLFHYNGLSASNRKNCKVEYLRGTVKVIGSEEEWEISTTYMINFEPIMNVLRTKWPNLQVEWDENITPSIS